MSQKIQIQNLLKSFKATTDDKGIPTLSKQEWKKLNDQYDKETIIEGLIEYIRVYKPQPPMTKVNEQDMIACFHRLKSAPYTKFFLTREETVDRVLEKYDDYAYPYDKHGLGVIQMGNSYCDVSNYFNQKLRMECDVYGFRSAHHRWNNVEDLRTVFLALWRLGNDHLDEYAFVVAFRLATYIATQFKPNVAKFVYDATGSKSIFDSSCGWGDRLAGFYCSNAEKYVGCDPNPQTFEMYKKQCIAYEKLLGCNNPKIIELGTKVFRCEGKKTVEIARSAAEDILASTPKNIDCAFTSPPYFSTELYNAGGKYEDAQSWKRYNTYEEWKDKFYLPVNRSIFENLKDGGIMIVNIQDPKVHNVRYRASDDLINDLTTKYNDCNFIGNLGMRVMQRPRNIDKSKMSTHFDRIYIEPMWCFGKNRKTLTMNNGEGLLNFMT
jgi:hypothetical protein